MKKLLLLLTILITNLLPAQTNFVETFDLNIGSLNNQNQWQGNASFQVVSDMITLADYPQTNSESKALRVQSSGGNIGRGNLLPISFASGAAYLSFVVRIDDENELPTFPQLQLGFEKALLTTTFGGLGFYKQPLSGDIELSLTTQSIADEATTSGANLMVGTVYHVVLKYEYAAAANDLLKVYLSPTFMATEPAIPTLQTTVTGTGLPDEIGRLLINAPVGSTGMMTVDGIQFGNAWNGEFDAGLLPVSLADFEGDLRAGTAHLRWRTLNETNNEGFIIEHSADGRTFTAIGEVAGFGNSQNEIHYHFEDDAPLRGRNYYRLAQRDYSGAIERSEIIILENQSPSATFRLFPNPTVDFLHLRFAASTDVHLRIVHIDGTIMPVPAASAPSDERTIDVRSWPRGIYVLEVTDTGGQQESSRFVVQ